MGSYAGVNLIGYVGQEPEIGYLPSGDEVASFSLATSRKRKDQEITTWWRCNAFGATVKVVREYVKKGDQLSVQGEAMLRPYTDRDGVPRQSLDCSVQRLLLLGSRTEKPVAYAKPEAPSSAPSSPRPAAAPMQDAPFDDDLPF